MADAEYIAALSPDVVLKLIAVARAARAVAAAFSPSTPEERELADALAALEEAGE